MEFSHLDDAVALLEKANAELQPELLTVAGARERLEVYARARKLVGYGIAALAARIDDAQSLARTTGTSVPQATDTIRHRQGPSRLRAPGTSPRARRHLLGPGE